MASTAEFHRKIELVQTTATEFKTQELINQIEKEIISNGRALVKSINAVYLLRAQKGNEVAVWVVDVKNGNGSVKYDQLGNSKGDVICTMTDDNWVKLLKGQLNPQEAYFNGQLKLSGNIGLAMKLQKLMQSNHFKSKL